MKTCKAHLLEEAEHEKKGGLSLNDWLANEDNEAEEEDCEADDEADGEDESGADVEDRAKMNHLPLYYISLTSIFDYHSQISYHCCLIIMLKVLQV